MPRDADALTEDELVDELVDGEDAGSASPSDSEPTDAGEATAVHTAVLDDLDADEDSLGDMTNDLDDGLEEVAAASVDPDSDDLLVEIGDGVSVGEFDDADEFDTDADPGRSVYDDPGDAPALFDGDPEEYDLEIGERPLVGEPGDGDVLVFDDPAAAERPVQRRMSRVEHRRRVKLQARRVRRIVRHVEPWSVLKISLMFYACLWVIFLIAGFMIWGVAESSGTVGKLENLIKDLFALTEFTIDAGEVFQGYALGGLALCIAGATFNVLMCLLFNLISDLTGGLRITMIEEETARPEPPRRRRRRTAPRR